MPKVVSRVSNARPLLIKQIAAETARLIAEDNASIISLSQGTPNLPIFPAAAEAMNQLIQGTKIPYTDVPGIPEVRARAAEFINAYYNPTEENVFRKARNPPIETPIPPADSLPLPYYQPQYTAANVMLTSGAAQAVYNVLALSIESPTDIVVSPLPAYGLYAHQTGILGGTFVPLESQPDNDFIPTVQDFESIFQRYTVTNPMTGQLENQIKSIVLCFPNNPMGTTLSAMEASQLALFFDQQLQKGYDFTLLLDEVYIAIERGHWSILHFATPRLLNCIFLVGSASKGCGAMPGARAGFLIAPSQYIQEMIKIQMACTANSSSISQRGLYGSLTYLLSNPHIVNSIYSHYIQRVELTKQRLHDIGIKYFGRSLVRETSISSKQHSTFYLMCDFTPFSWCHNDIEVQQFLRDEYKNGDMKMGVAVVPGSAFSLSSQWKLIRLSCAVELVDIEKAMSIIEAAIVRMLKQAK